MNPEEEMDQFQLLEEKIDSLIKFINSIKKEKESLAEKLHIQDRKISDLSGELENLRASRNKAKQRIVALLNKIEQLDIS
ncbi:MAG: cell division protein ZapB [Deltaproteobacteria bacterium]|jgi:chromosome segregation ATPase|nr:cell division protein ZapB [Deltaproteobacteria bacterium]